MVAICSTNCWEDTAVIYILFYPLTISDECLSRYARLATSDDGVTVVTQATWYVNTAVSKEAKKLLKNFKTKLD